ncbi:MAG TPA: tetratricopeptide repeat protein [Burkholderiales bacterium]|nr:tetratricopeptide repeat protein [Burkholderiales bacterium]
MPGLSRSLATLIIALCILLGACAQREIVAARDATHFAAADADLSAQAQPESLDSRAREVKVLAVADLPERALDSELLYKFLLAEIAVQHGHYQVAAQTYLDLAKSTRDPRIARRATEVALYGRYTDAALEAAKLWLAAEPDSTAARQTLAALYVNSNDLQAAKPLLQQMLAADGDNIGESLAQLYPLLAKHDDKIAVLALVKELTQPYRDRPEAHLAMAEASLGADKYDAALSEIREAMRLRPDWESGALFQAQVLNRESRAKALNYLSGFLATYPKAQEVRLGYARQLINDKKFAEARAEFQRLLDDNPNNSDLAVTVALLSVQMNDLDVAETQLKRVLDMDYKDPEAVRFHLGQIAEERKRYDEAAKWYLSIETGEQYVAAHSHYAFMLAKQGKLAEARDHLRGLEPQNDAQRIQLLQSEAQLMREAKDYQESFNILNKALKAQPDQPDLLYDVALAAEKLDRIDIAEANLRRLIVLKPDHAQAYNALGYTLADRTDRLTEARGYIEQALKLSPEDPFILDSMGWVEYRLGHVSQGLQYLERAFQQRPDPEIAAHLGEVLWAKGDKPGAEKVWRDAFRDNPENDELQKVITKYLR